MAIDTSSLFLFYEGRDPSYFTPLTGVNLNKNARLFKEILETVNGKVEDLDSTSLESAKALLDRMNEDIVQKVADLDLRNYSDVEDAKIRAQLKTALDEIHELKIKLAFFKPSSSGLSAGDKANIDTHFLISAFNISYIAEQNRFNFGTGLLGVRNYFTNEQGSGFDATMRTHMVAAGNALHQHNHPNYYGMIGLGELAGVANGYYFRTTHNDPILADSRDRMIHAPDIRPEVLAKPTGVTFSNDSLSYDFTGDTQAKYFRNLYKDNLGDVFLMLTYLEVWLEEMPDPTKGIENNILSFRHNETASKLLDILKFSNRMSYSGTKDPGENISFRAGIIPVIKDDGQPTYAYINYRVRAQKVGNMKTRSPKTSFSESDVSPDVVISMVAAAVGGTHGHSLNVGLSHSDMNKLIANGSIVVESTFNKAPDSAASENHSHLYLISWNGGNPTALDIGGRSNANSGSTFRSATSSQPAVNEWRDYAGNWNTTPIVWEAIGFHVHPATVLQDIDQYPFDLYKAANHIIDNTNRWKLVKDHEALNRLRISKGSATWLDLAKSSLCRWTLDEESMDSMIRKCWGLDGEGSVIYESVNNLGEILNTYDTRSNTRLNAAKYNRVYGIGGNDASGRSTGPRGFNDPTLYVAKTTKSNVVEGYSYLIPLEVVVRSPSEKWNPLRIKRSTGAPPGGAGDGSKGNPRISSYDNLWFSITPAGLYNVSATDPADTVSSGVWTRSEDGNAYPVDDSGIFLTRSGLVEYKDPTNNQVISTEFRFRYVVAPDANRYGHAHYQYQGINEQVKELLKKVVRNQLTENDINNMV